jgi:hypothetical protein
MFWSGRAMAIALFAALVAGLVWLNGARTYGDVRQGATSFSDGRLVFRDGRRVRLGTSVLNNGGRSIEVVAVGRERRVNLAPLRVSMAREEGQPRSVGLVPFRKFELEPGHQRYVEGLYRVYSCRDYELGSTLSHAGLDVRYKTLLFEHSAELPVRPPLTLVRRGRCSG